jgi:histidyl-tRNA synthetase
LEYAEVLLGKGGGETDKQVYRFEDKGGRDVAMRFDLTVPFARYIAGHLNELSLPFRRYHIGKVFRGENTQRGRFREFVQCDFDIVGADSLSADFEILQLISESFRALNVPRVLVRVSHRGIFNRMLARVAPELEDPTEVLRAVDKLPKIGRDRVLALLSERMSPKAAEAVLSFIEGQGSPEENISAMEDLSGGPASDSGRLRGIMRLAERIGLSDSIEVDPSITRGLDYYTGVVFETFLTDLPDIGSVCSGGRYNDLAALYSKQQIPGVGASIGLDRLVAALEELGSTEDAGAASEVLVFCLDEELMPEYHALARAFRRKGLSAEVYPEGRKLGAQFSYAEKLGIPVGAIFGPEEAKSRLVNVKNLRTRESFDGLDWEAAAQRAIALRD